MVQCEVKSVHKAADYAKGIGDTVEPWSYPFGQLAWDPISAALIRLDALYEYAVEHGDEAEAERLREELSMLVDRL